MMYICTTVPCPTLSCPTLALPYPASPRPPFPPCLIISDTRSGLCSVSPTPHSNRLGSLSLGIALISGAQASNQWIGEAAWLG